MKHLNRKEFLTVSEFAEEAKISRQVVYRKLTKSDNKLSTYCKLIDNKKYINKVALKEVFGIDSNETVEQQVDKKFTESVNKLTEKVNQLTEQMSLLKMQIKSLENDKQFLQAQLQQSNNRCDFLVKKNSEFQEISLLPKRKQRKALKEFFKND